MTFLLKGTPTIISDKSATIKQISFNLNPFSHKDDNSDIRSSQIIRYKPKSSVNLVDLDITNNQFLQNREFTNWMIQKRKKKGQKLI
jgi:hypothetical protein